MKRYTAVALVVLLVGASVARDEAASDALPEQVGSSGPSVPSASPAALEVEIPFYGIAGLVPPGFPEPTDEDWATFFGDLPQLGSSVGNYSPIADLARSYEVARAAGIEVLPVTGFHVDTESGLTVTVDFNDPGETDAFIAALVEFAEAYQPRYLGMGNEVNRVWEDHPAAFDAWVLALPQIVDAIHDVSPDTAVSVTFQYEFLTGRSAITGVPREEDWAPFEAVEPYLDLVAFTTYPYFEYVSPADVPADYYAAIEEHTSLPVGFTEVGWLSAPIAPLEGSVLADLGGTPEEQSAFVGRLRDLMAGLRLEFVMWVWAYDSEAVGPIFSSLGLSDNDASPKPARDGWRALAGR